MTVGNERFFYMRPVNGDDSNDGLSFNTAWKTWTKVIDELCTDGTSYGGSADNAGLYLVNETGDAGYTGPYPTGLSVSTTVDWAFTSIGNRFTLLGLSADGSFDADINFIFDLSGFTGSNWYLAFLKYTGTTELSFRNITWRNATTSTNYIFNTGYDNEIGSLDFYRCIFEDNELNSGLVAVGGYSNVDRYYNCIVRRNNTYNNNYGLFPAGSYSVTTNRQPGSWFYRSIIHDNQTDPSASQYTLNTNSLGGQGIELVDCAIYNNGNVSTDITIFLHHQDERAQNKIKGCVFFNNAGTAVYVDGAISIDALYGRSSFGHRFQGNVFAYNNKSIEFEYEPGLRDTHITNNIFWQNTAVDIPTYIDGVTGMEGANYVVDPEFTNGYSGDFSVPETSPCFTYAGPLGLAIGGIFVNKISTGGGGGSTAEYVTVF